MSNCTFPQEIDDEYFIRMMIPKIRLLAQSFEEEEEFVLSDLISELHLAKDDKLVVVGAGTLSYVEIAIKYDINYIAVDPFLDIYLQKQTCFLIEHYNNITCINKTFGAFDTSLLGEGRKVFAFIFNIIGYIKHPIEYINKYIRKGDILFFATWNNDSRSARKVRDDYFSVLNNTYHKNEGYNSNIGLYNLNNIDFSKLSYYTNHKRILSDITDILIINC